MSDERDHPAGEEWPPPEPTRVEVPASAGWAFDAHEQSPAPDPSAAVWASLGDAEVAGGDGDGPTPVGAGGSPTSRGRRRWPVLVAVVVAVALAAGGAVVFVTRDRGPSYPSAWDSRLTDLVSAVEKAKKASFVHPVRAVFLDEAAFKRRVGVNQAELSKQDRKDVARAEETLRALGLQGGTGSLLDQLNTMQTEGIAAFYDPDRKEIVIPESPDRPLAAKKTLVHELTHALQDQLGQLHKPDGSDAKDAYTALVEGDAQHVATIWANGLSGDDADALATQTADQSSEATTAVKTVNPALVALFTAPYTMGEAMVTALDDAGKLDGAFSHPPQSTADVLEPSRWLQPVDVVTVTEPPLRTGEREEGAVDTLGAQSVYLMLASALPPIQALAAASGWAGDQMRFFRAADGAGCVRVTVAGVDAAATTRLDEAVAAWVKTRPGGAASSKRVDDRIEFEACDRGSASASLTDAVANVPADRAQLVVEFTHLGLTVPQADCVASGLIERVPPELFATSELTTDQQDQIQQAAQAAAMACRS